MPRHTSARACSSLALLFGLVACGEAPTRPVMIASPGTPSANILRIGDLRRSVPGTPCSAPEYRQFDFWLGEWRVTTDGALDGTNNVTPELDGCVVAEHWNDVGEVKGWSLNAYDRTTGFWYQHWVDETGLNLLLSGQLQNGTMVLAGPRRTLAGALLIDRVAYTPLGGGAMRQLWDRSFDDGATFPLVVFDGLYTPEPGVTPPPAPGTSFCAGAAFRAADFLLGEWRVEAENGLELGRSTITAELSTCLVLERFSTPKGYEAKAFLSYARAAQRWNRTHVDSEGNRIFLAGPANSSGLVLTGDIALPSGERVLTRLTWSATRPDSLEQLWEVSRDNGATWLVDERLVYVR